MRAATKRVTFIALQKQASNGLLDFPVRLVDERGGVGGVSSLAPRGGHRSADDVAYARRGLEHVCSTFQPGMSSMPSLSR
jgi:hypothetical protein